MAFSDLCKISNAYKAVENEPDQSERIMEENSMVRDIITKILDETGPADGNNIQSPEKRLGVGAVANQYNKNNAGNTSFASPPSSTSYNAFQDSPLYNFPAQTQSQSGFNYPNVQNGFSNTNGYVNYSDNDIGTLLGVDSLGDAAQEAVSPEQLNLLRLAAQEIAGAQFSSPPTNKFDDKYFNYYEPSQRNSAPDPNLYAMGNGFNRPSSLNMDSLGYNSNQTSEGCGPYSNMSRYPNKFPDSNIQLSQESPNNLLAYLTQIGINEHRPNMRDEVMMPNGMPDYSQLNGSMNYQNGDDSAHFKPSMDDMLRNKMYQNFNQNNFQQMPGSATNSNVYLNEMMKQRGTDKSYGFAGQNFDGFPNVSPNVSAPNSMGYKPNGFQHHSDTFVPRRDNMANPMMGSRDGYQGNIVLGEQRSNFDSPATRDNLQQANMMRQQEIARQMSMLMLNRPPPNQLNVDVSLLHENAPFNLGLGALLGPSPPVAPPVLPSPTVDMPLLAPFYALRSMRRTATTSAVLHGRLEACYEQWRQLERERKRTEARLALAYPGRAVSSSNSIPVPRLPPCPTRVDRLTIDMLREHAKVLTLMGKMETLRASVCVALNKKSTKPNEDGKITVLKRGQDSNVTADSQPSTSTEVTCDMKSLTEIAPHSEVESAMLAWRNAVAGVQAARRREVALSSDRYQRADPILQLSEAVKQLSVCARRARCAMWCDLTLTVALAPSADPPPTTSDKPQGVIPTNQENSNTPKPSPNETKEEKWPEATKPDGKHADNKPTKPQEKPNEPKSESQQQRNQQRRASNYRHKVNQQGRPDFYQKNQRYEQRFPHRHPYHFMATGSIN